MAWNMCRAEEAEDKGRSTAIAHFKAIGAALHKHHVANKTLPAPASVDKEGKVLLSWRVQILPFLDEHKLYAEFHLDEPWDSDHNKKLIAKMPEVFVNPRVPEVGEGMTTFQLPVAADTAFEPGKRTRLQEIKDGTANTIMVVEVAAKHAIEWTRPKELAWEEAKPMDRLYFDGRKNSLSLFVSGDVNSLSEGIGPDNFRSYFLRSDGRVTKGAVDAGK